MRGSWPLDHGRRRDRRATGAGQKTDPSTTPAPQQPRPRRSRDGPGLRLPDGSGHSFQRARQVFAVRDGAGRGNSRSDRIPPRSHRDAEAGEAGRAGTPDLEVFDPWKDHRVEKFSVVHEKLFHAFIISRDLQFFVHDHPTWENGAFHYDIAFPKPGMYRVLGDFYPEAAAPQLITETLFVAGGDMRAGALSRDYSIKDGGEPQGRVVDQSARADRRCHHADAPQRRIPATASRSISAPGVTCSSPATI